MNEEQVPFLIKDLMLYLSIIFYKKYIPHNVVLDLNLYITLDFLFDK